MSKYTKLTTTKGLQVGDSVYLPAHGGKKEMIVVNINHEQNSIAAIFHAIYIKGQTDPDVRGVIQNLFSNHFTDVTKFYKKHTPKSRTPSISFSQEPLPEEPTQPTRTPDMYNFD